MTTKREKLIGRIRSGETTDKDAKAVEELLTAADEFNPPPGGVKYIWLGIARIRQVLNKLDTEEEPPQEDGG